MSAPFSDLISLDNAQGWRMDRRHFLLASTLLLVPIRHVAAASNDLVAVRVWPADDYTRLTLESRAPLKFSQFTIKNPERLVVDIEGIDINPELQALANKVNTDDPYIKSVRAGRYKPTVVRLVLDLKQAIKPQIFTLPPVAEYANRLVIDLYPAQEREWSAKQERNKNADKNEKLADKNEKSSKKPRDKDDDDNLPNHTGRALTVAIDPGHGGEDPGAVGRNGSYEKNIVLDIGRKLKSLVGEESSLRAVLIRDGDYFIPLHQRVEKARRAKADLFLSIHADAFINTDARGSSVFALSERGATSAAARWLAKKENDADLIGGVRLDVKDPVLAKTLLDLSQTATIADGLKFANHVLGELGGINRLHKPHVEQAGFAVLKAPDIPSILVETAFISNPEEERKLNDEDYQQKMAKALLKGIKRYFAKHPTHGKSGKIATKDGNDSKNS